MEDLINAQLAQREILHKFVINYKKDGKDKRTKVYYGKRLENFEALWDTFKNRHTEILTKKYADKSFNEQKYEYFSKDMFTEMEEFFYDHYAQIRDRFEEEFGTEQSNLTVTKPPEDTVLKNANPTAVKLPKIYLEKFSGNYRKWPTFHDLFKSLIHENGSLADVQKLQYLKMHLSGEPEQLLRQFQVTDDNYQSAWNLLKNRYDNKRILVNTHLKVLLSQPTITNESAQGIKGLLDTTTECLQALNNLEINTSNWDPLIIYFVVQRLPAETHQLWEQGLSQSKDLPAWKALKEFLEARFRTLEAVSNKKTSSHKEPRAVFDRIKSNSNSFHVTSSTSCIICFGNHSVRQCPTFLSCNSIKRMETVKSKGLCINCLGSGHILANCPSQHKCWHCQNRHHTLLHRKPNEISQSVHQNNAKCNKPTNMTTNYNSYQSSATPDSAPSDSMRQSSLISQSLSPASQPFIPNESVPHPTDLNSFMVSKSSTEHVLLATAMVKVIAHTGREQIVRALIDQGSQASFLSESIAQDLGLKKESIAATVHGLGKDNTNHIKHRVQFTIKSLKGDDAIKVSGFILKKLTDFLPTENIFYQQWDHLKGLELADPLFHRPGKVDLLLGADIYSQIIMEGLIRGRDGSPTAQKTTLGWILSGKVSTERARSIDVKNFHVCTELENQLKRFWEIEELQEATNFTDEEQRCEKIFVNTTRRLSNGRYEVEIPFKEESVNQYLGKSRSIAVNRLLQLERRFSRDPKLKEEYCNCLNEYLTLGHMQRVDTSEEDHAKQLRNVTAYSCSYLPHHGVIKETSSTTKLRVVFDASRPTESGTSLNDMMYKGPTIQDELAALLIRWRKNRVAFVADLEKMYRQIHVKEPLREYQRIVWRNSTMEPICDYKLSTVTFGTKSAPFLATRVLKQLAIDEMERFPIGSKMVLSDFYVDDLISGADSVEAALSAQTELINLMMSGGFSLRKWSSNCKKLLESLPTDQCETQLPLQITAEESVRTLGINWNPIEDILSFTLRLDDQPTKWTKRRILSETSRLFDPLGLIAPVIISAKIMIQKLWLTGLGWDDEIPPNLQEEWVNYRNNIMEIRYTKINRWVQFTSMNTTVELHGFADASQKAYAAAVYVCIVDHSGQRHSNLLTAKTKVAPLKTVTLPRLELSAAALLAKLLQYVMQALNLEKTPSVYSWSDSEIVIAWLKSHPRRWNTFVANRVAYIQNALEKNVWGHVPSKDNPADCASRGMHPGRLGDYKLWWHGPDWLCKSKEHWPRINNVISTNFEERKTYNCHVSTEFDKLEFKYSSLMKLLRVTAYCKRFIHNCRVEKRERKTDYLKATEIQHALLTWLKRVQSVYFHDEITLLARNKPCSRHSRILNLNPFLDNNGLLRVGGRLRHSELSYEEQHPIILPSKSNLTVLIINKIHKETLHGGAQLMMNILFKKYWLLNARNVIRQQIHKCLRCYKQKCATQTQLMGDLPAPRIRMSRPFTHTGVDYCGPFELKTHKGRNPKRYKAYISLFVCMATKAVHLELVTDLTAEGFIAALRRFCARRGLCQEIYCDCGSNFIGARRLLKEQHQQLIEVLNIDIASMVENEGIKFNFIPPSAPHFGGLWEAGVRSTKFHLKRVLGSTLLTYEEFTTLLTQVEACLNSRPLCEMNNDPNDLNPLTPAHFLIGGTLLTPPEPSVLNEKINRLDRWQYLQRLLQNFWKRWQVEYLHRLQQRPKWTNKTENVKIGDLVLVKDENLPPTRWMLGRITETHPGTDGLVRVVSLKVKDKSLQRPITKICKLPIQEDLQK